MTETGAVWRQCSVAILAARRVRGPCHLQRIRFEDTHAMLAANEHLERSPAPRPPVAPCTRSSRSPALFLTDGRVRGASLAREGLPDPRRPPPLLSERAPSPTYS